MKSPIRGVALWSIERNEASIRRIAKNNVPGEPLAGVFRKPNKETFSDVARVSYDPESMITYLSAFKPFRKYESRAKIEHDTPEIGRKSIELTRQSLNDDRIGIEPQPIKGCADELGGMDLVRVAMHMRAVKINLME